MLHLSDNKTITSSVDECFPQFPRIDLISDQELLVTEGQHVVSIHDMDDETGVSGRSRCLTFSHIKPLSCPIVYDRLRKKLVAVLGSNEVRIFDREEDMDTDQPGERYKFSRVIAGILSNPAGEPILLFTDASISLLTSAIETRSEGSSSTTDKEDFTDILKVKVIVTQQMTGFVIDVMILHRAKSKQVVCDRLRMDQDTGMTEKYESISMPDECIAFAISDNVSSQLTCLAGVTRDGVIILMRDSQVTRIRLESIPSSFLQEVKVVTFFPHEEDVIAVCHTIGPSAFVITAIDVRYGSHESYPIECEPVMNGIEVRRDQMFILTSKGIIEKRLKIKPKPLCEIFAQSMDPEASENTNKRHRSSDLSSKTTEEIIQVMKRQRKDAAGKSGIDSEKCMASLLLHMVESDPELTSVSSDQLMEQVIRMPFNQSFLVRELRWLSPQLKSQQALLLVSKLLDRLDEHDEYGVYCINISNSILDVCLTQILLDKELVMDQLMDLSEKNDRLAEYCKSLFSIKSMVDAIISRDTRTRVRRGKPEYELVKIRI